MDAQKSSLSNFVVDFLLRENYLLTAFELLHELVEDGRHDQAIRLREFFSDSSIFPPDQIARFSSLRVADPQSVLEEKETLQEKLAISEYELRLAQEDLAKLKEELQKISHLRSSESNGLLADHSEMDGVGEEKRRSSVDLGSLKDEERRVLNCAVKEYLMLAGYRLTAMTFYEEVTDQNLDIWPNSPAFVHDALRHYYYQYLSSTTDAAEEKIAILRDRDRLLEETKRLACEMESLQKQKDLVETRLSSQTRMMETTQKEVKEKDLLVHDLKQSVELQRKELNECRAEITSLKMYIESSRTSQRLTCEKPEELEENSFQRQAESSESGLVSGDSMDPKSSFRENMKTEDKTVITQEDTPRTVDSKFDNLDATFNTHTDDMMKSNDVTVNNHTDVAVESNDVSFNTHTVDAMESNTVAFNTQTDDTIKSNDVTSETSINFCNNEIPIKGNHDSCGDPSVPPEEISSMQTDNEKTGLEAIHILSDALPKIVPYVLINHREELLPLIICAIERHPESSQRDLLTHTLFNLIKRPDEQQRRIIMDACLILAKNVGEMRTETELLPQCWEQINHTYEERRLLVAQSCGELAEFVRPEIRDSLILSIIQQLVEDSSAIVRQAAANNLALLLPFFPNMDKCSKVEGLMFQLLCDPSGLVVETSLRELVPSVLNWGDNLDHVVRVLFSNLLGFTARCPPLSGVEGTVESHLRFLGERERWNVEVLLRTLINVLPFVYDKVVKTCPFASSLDVPESTFISLPLLQLYSGGHADWALFDWILTECLPDLIQLSCFLPTREDHLRVHMRKFLLDMCDIFGDEYVTLMILPIFLEAVGDHADLSLLPMKMHSKIRILRPKTVVTERLSTLCVLPLLLGGILGNPRRNEQLEQHLRKLFIQNAVDGSQRSSIHRATDLLDSIRFLCMFNEHHAILFNILWEMVVSLNTDLKINAIHLLKVMVPYIDAKVASTHILPALVTLGSDQNIDVKYATIDAFGIVAQHFKSDMIVEKIRIQMDSFLEDGSHEATIAILRALCLAVPQATEKLKDYLLSKIFRLSGSTFKGDNLGRRCERANAFCEAIRALDATDLPAASTREMLLPAIQNLLKDGEALDPAHKEALEVILRERSGGALETISKAMGIASSVGNFFSDGGLILGKKVDGVEAQDGSELAVAAAVSDDTRFRRIMRGNFGDMLRSRTKAHDEGQNA